eukprot:15702705-Heterocapsa_arctica.AAC.1
MAVVACGSAAAPRPAAVPSFPKAVEASGANGIEVDKTSGAGHGDPDSTTAVTWVRRLGMPDDVARALQRLGICSCKDLAGFTVMEFQEMMQEQGVVEEGTLEVATVIFELEKALW